MAAGAEGVWIVGRGRPEAAHAVRMESTGLTTTVPVGIAPSAVAVGGGAVWVANGSGQGPVYGSGPGPGYPAEHSLAKIDPQTGAVIGEIPADNPSDVAFGHGSVWVLTTSAVLRVDPVSMEVEASIDIGDLSPGRLAISPASVWVLSDFLRPPSLARIDPTVDTVVSTVAVETFGGIAVVGDRIWLYRVGGLEAIDDITGKQVETVEGRFGYGLTGGDQGVWVSDFDGMAFLIEVDGAQPIGPCPLPEPPIAGAADAEGVWFLGESTLTFVVSEGISTS